MKSLNILLASIFFQLCSGYEIKTTIENPQKNVIWSILICTLESRSQTFNRIYNKLQKQIAQQNLQDEIEIIYCKDNREMSIGEKRNILMQYSKGKYVNFLDDDDDVHNKYIKMVYEKLLKSPDCVNLIGIITYRGKNPGTFVHSLDYKTYFEKDGIKCRPPNHLNPIRRDIAIQFKFPDINAGEDSDWCMQIVNSNLLKKEEKIKVPYYYYLYDPYKTN